MTELREDQEEYMLQQFHASELEAFEQKRNGLLENLHTFRGYSFRELSKMTGYPAASICRWVKDLRPKVVDGTPVT